MKKKFLKLLGTLLLALVVVCSVFTIKGYVYYTKLQREQPLYQLMLNVENQDDFISFDELPQDIYDATISIEDRRYLEHDGIDYISLIRAILSQFTPIRSGGSTITQQTAKNLYGLYDSNIDRKFAEIFLATYLERNFTKEQIFAVYVNIINYGDNSTGIVEASKNYFGLYPTQLNLQQCAILAGIPQSPANYQLSDHYDQAKVRQKQVLEAMASCGYITEDDVDYYYNLSIY